jgi:hypothetical protein
MLLRWLPRVFFALGISLLILSGYLYYLEMPEPATTIDEMDRVVEGAQAGKVTDLVFPLHNPKGREIRIVGLPEC